MEICHNSTSLSWNQSSSGNDREKLGRLAGDMEFQDQLESDGSRYLYSQPPAAFDRGCGATAGRSADAHCNIWMDAERTATRNYNNLSLAMNARLRLESLKSGYNSAAPRCVTGGLLDKYKHLCDDEDSQESILDSVELLDVEDDVQDEESWLYQPSKTTFENRSQSALGWCRHVLDNPSPETEAACRSLINKLQHCSDRYFHRCPAVFRHSGSVGSSGPQTSHSADYSGLNSCRDATNSSYKLQDITDVHIVARMQEASLRHDFNSTPVSRRAAEPSATFPSYFDTFDETTQIKSGASLSSCWRSDVPSLNPSRRSLTSSESQRSCQSPKLSRLQQQVTQFKLLKLAQNQGAPTVQTRSPLRTSLRSLQAVRNSRSLDTDDYQPPDSQITYQPSGASADKLGSRFWSPSLLRPAAVLRSVRDHEKRQQRSQSASPRRIPHSARAHLSIIGRVFASPERGTAPAWARGGPSTQR
ncbi:hypothetical protein fugu_009193 [Takifugu bimaculatus]|uniref:SLAIN motif-containing protein-like n=1 Tax=Takifugu bimaculatus TaxID=433685 RepID=A0A4Z2AZG0_9TELE|nr:hypothetical protein fugu_009193 [Takifugu bimaculatus]